MLGGGASSGVKRTRPRARVACNWSWMEALEVFGRLWRPLEGSRLVLYGMGAAVPVAVLRQVQIGGFRV